jgi:hypothetical protein
MRVGVVEVLWIQTIDVVDLRPGDVLRRNGARVLGTVDGWEDGRRVVWATTDAPETVPLPMNGKVVVSRELDRA